MVRVGMIAAFVLTLVWLLPWSDIILKRHPKWNRAFKWITFAVYVLANLRETLLFRKVLTKVNVRLTPFSIHVSMIRKIAEQLSQGALNWKALRGLEDILLNILLYVPMGYLLPWLWTGLRAERREGFGTKPALLSGWVVLIGAVCTLITEWIQWNAHIGTFEVDDLINNMLGCIIGCVLYEIAVRTAETIKRKRLRADE